GGLTSILGEATDPAHTFGTDDESFGDLAADPLTRRWDLGADALAWAASRVAQVDDVFPKLEGRLLGADAPYARLRRAVGLPLGPRLEALGAATGVIGGVSFERQQHAGGKPPLQVVPAARQREALKLIVDKAFAERAVAIPPELLAKLVPNRAGDLDATIR